MRDPRVDPRKGDVVRDGDWVRTVKQRVGSGVWIHFWSAAANCDGDRFVPMEEWVRVSKKVAILKVAESAEGEEGK